jgi:hypothetical protein
MKEERLFEIWNCYFHCPLFSTEQGGVMVCSHPEVPNSGYIINLDNSKDKFPDECPLRKEEYVITKTVRIHR